jgi:hypothetical protein
MLRQYLVGAAASICNIAIHALVMVIVIKVTRIADELATRHQTLRLIAVMIAAVTVLMIAHLAEVLVWSFICDIPRRAGRIGHRLFCLCKLHNAWLWRRDASRALAFARAHDRDERRAVVWLVNGSGF